MNEYESVIIMDDSLEENQKKQFIRKISKFIAENGKLTKVEELGTKKLAYEIRKQKTGYYCIFYFYAKPIVISALERIYRITDKVIKFINVRVDG